MSYKILKRKNAPKSAKNYKLQNKTPDDMGMVNLGGDIEDDLKEIVNAKISNSNSMVMYFPLFENSYVKEFKSTNGFTVKKIIKLINSTGAKALAEDWKTNPENYRGVSSAKEASTAIGENAITNLVYNEKNGVLNLYVELQH